jgi:hypothetical protein
MAEPIDLALAAESVSIESLVLDPANARNHGDLNIASIEDSLARFGQRLPIVVQKQGRVVRAGNGRVIAARNLGWTEIAAVIVDEGDEEAMAFAIADNRTAELAEWDDEALSTLLTDLGPVPGFSAADIEELARKIGAVEEEYTKKIISPIYEPEGPKPKESELSDRATTNDLLAEIAAAELPDDVRRFLVSAAERHTVFKFDRIANYYAHADENIQKLFERSVLVILDFEQAVERGFVTLTDRVEHLFREDYPDAE